jgi:hypothetical protein
MQASCVDGHATWVPASSGRLKAAAETLDAIGTFLTERLEAHASGKARN